MRLRALILGALAIVILIFQGTVAFAMSSDEMYIPPRLFDIDLTLVDTQIKSTENFIAKISLKSFGTEPTPVDITFKIAKRNDENSILYTTTKTTKAVETQNIYTQKFDDLKLSPGEYSLIVKTEYKVDLDLQNSENINVSDSFKKDFVILVPERSWYMDILQYIKSLFLDGVYTNSQVASVAMVESRAKILLTDINKLFERASADVLGFSKISSMTGVVDGEMTDEDLKRLEQDFEVLLGVRKQYYQIRYIDETGKEIARVESNGNGDMKRVHGDDLQDKSSRYYFKDAIKMKRGEVFVSVLDLNKEYGKVENRGIANKSFTIPTVRYATHIFDANGKSAGIVIINIYADYFLDEIRRFKRGDEFAVLLNSKGDYIAHPDKTKEINSGSGGGNFYYDYPNVDKKALGENFKKQISTDKKIIFMEKVYLASGIYGTNTEYKQHSDIGNYWILATISDKADLIKSGVGKYLLLIILLIIISIFSIISLKRML